MVQQVIQYSQKSLYSLYSKYRQKNNCKKQKCFLQLLKDIYFYLVQTEITLLAVPVALKPEIYK